VTEADFAPERLSGGFGRDSVPGVDYPIFEGPESGRWSRLRTRQEFYGLESPDGPRGYPADLLRKIEVVNDRDSEGPFAIVFDRSRDEAHFYGRTLDGDEITFGTTGYAYGQTDVPDTGRPLLYDRSTRSLWLPDGGSLVCVSGKSRGARLPEIRTPERTTWSRWVSKHPGTKVLMGNDRDKPIPER
jgi:hypothetical protein